MRRLLLTLGIILSLMQAHAQGYKNPVIEGFYPDPSICHAGDDFYLVNSSFQFFPGVPLFHSKDLVNWEQIGNVLDRPSQLPLAGATCWGGIYAPTIRYNDGTFYMITTNCSSKGNFIVYTDDPYKGWSDPVWLEQGGIDPSLYFEDGHCYMVSNPDDAIWLCEIDPKTGKQVSQSRRIWEGNGGRYPEAPHIYKKDGFYYLMMAEGGTESAHSEIIGRSKWIDGPYESNPANPILTHCKRTTQKSPIQGTGHADLVEAPDGSWWMVFLAYREMDGVHHNTGRETYLAPVRWDDGAWPVVNADGSVSIDMDVETLPLHPFAAPTTMTDFKAMGNSKGFADVMKALGPQWVFMRNPVEKNYQLKNGLVMKTSADGLGNAQGFPSFVAKRQTTIDFTVTTKVHQHNATSADESGLTLFMTEDSHYDLFITKNAAGKPVLKLRYKLIAMEHIEAEIPIEKDECVLRASGNKERYSFAYSTDGIHFKDIASMSTRYLSSECAGGFTGVTLGLYSESKNPKTKAEAMFDYYELTR